MKCTYVVRMSAPQGAAHRRSAFPPKCPSRRKIKRFSPPYVSPSAFGRAFVYTSSNKTLFLIYFPEIDCIAQTGNLPFAYVKQCIVKNVFKTSGMRTLLRVQCNEDTIATKKAY